MSFDRQNSNDPTFHSSMHSGSTLTHNHPSMHGAMFQTSMGLAWPPSLHPGAMDLHAVGSPHSPATTGLSSLPSPPVALPKPATGQYNSSSSITPEQPPSNKISNTSPPDGSKPNRGSQTNPTTAITTTTTSSSSSSTSSSPPPPSSTTNAAASSPVDLSKPYHSEWGVMKEQDFHPLTLKHQRDLENIHTTGNVIADFYFWQANLGGYCMADMVQNIVLSSEGAFPLIRRIVEGAPHPGRRKKKRTPA
ncbi:hypothetical protein BCR42DRAFT_399736 [Absidia repens]|uniref:Uncharacterized protein n=1 Tax=Absidia repens TaxID=90262 RepID=A0A1X2J0A5_9FUNG|nr:hypothetical protein BCR42DRAFT_399736 [Absidia repens]